MLVQFVGNVKKYYEPLFTRFKSQAALKTDKTRGIWNSTHINFTKPISIVLLFNKLSRCPCYLPSVHNRYSAEYAVCHIWKCTKEDSSDILESAAK